MTAAEREHLIRRGRGLFARCAVMAAAFAAGSTFWTRYGELPWIGWLWLAVASFNVGTLLRVHRDLRIIERSDDDL